MTATLLERTRPQRQPQQHVIIVIQPMDDDTLAKHLVEVFQRSIESDPELQELLAETDLC